MSPELPRQDAARVVCRTRSGAVAGGLSAVAGVTRFLGIPYAAPPIGSLRWQPPQPPIAWSGVRNATHASARCIQHAPYGEIEPGNPAMSEDCLYLNIWTPAPREGAKLPVLFWVHGGEFFAGSGTEERYDGGRLAARGCVVVTLNHRLGVFGFLAHPELSEASPTGTSGNYGLMDLIACLEWVRDNIAEFGGDPGAVTLAGESAGSCVVSAFMAAPAARGLFHRGIGQSCAFFMGESHAMAPRGLEDNEEVGALFARIAGASSIADLRAVPGEQLLEVWLKNRLARFQPQIGDHILPRPIDAVFGEGGQAQVPLLAGWNREETAYMRAVPDRFDAGAYQRAFIAEHGSAAAAMWEAYLSEANGNDFEAMVALSGHRTMALPTWCWIDAHAHAAPTYAYRFDRTPPGTFGASHACEIEYAFGTLGARPHAWAAEDQALSEHMGDLWVNFVRAGNPNGKISTTWPTYDPSGPQVMHLGGSSKAGALREAGHLRALAALTTMRRPS